MVLCCYPISQKEVIIITETVQTTANDATPEKKSVLTQIKEGFRPTEGRTGPGKFLSRFGNLWKSGIAGKILIILMCPIGLVLLTSPLLLIAAAIMFIGVPLLLGVMRLIGQTDERLGTQMNTRSVSVSLPSELGMTVTRQVCVKGLLLIGITTMVFDGICFFESIDRYSLEDFRIVCALEFVWHGLCHLIAIYLMIALMNGYRRLCACADSSVTKVTVPKAFVLIRRFLYLCVALCLVSFALNTFASEEFYKECNYFLAMFDMTRLLYILPLSKADVPIRVYDGIMLLAGGFYMYVVAVAVKYLSLLLALIHCQSSDKPADAA